MTKNILVCDDTRSVLDFFHTWLHFAGYTVSRGDNLQKAQTLYNSITKFDLVISDDLGGGGVEWLGSLQKLGQPVLNTSAVISGPGMPSLPKPVKKLQFLGKVRSILGE